MARKNIFTNVMSDGSLDETNSDVTAGFKRFGASRSMSTSIDELAKQAAKLVEGETIVELSPELIDVSFVSDRIADFDDDYRELFEAIKERGQDSPILVRPHPTSDGRYMIVFGHRRVRVAKELGRNVRAVIKPLVDQDHVISQGQENSARANLSFIERVLFADRLDKLGYSRDTLQTALSIDYQTLSKMLTIPRSIPNDIISALGAAKGVGRDRWLELRKFIENPKHTATAIEFVSSAEFVAAPSSERFDLLYNRLRSGASKKPVKKAAIIRPKTTWVPSDKSVVVAQKSDGKSTTITLSASNGPAFGSWINENLESLYHAFRTSTQTSTGDE